MFTKINIIEENDFSEAWHKAILFVLAYGALMKFGSKKEPKQAFNSIQCIILYGHAINQILRGEFHPQYSFGGQRGDTYTNEFDRDWFLLEYSKFPEIKKFVYTYIGRIIRYTRPSQSIPEFIKYFFLKKECFTDQLVVVRDQLKEQIETGIISNRSLIITWMPFRDLFSNSPPCLQRINIVYLGNNEVEVHITWRSRDLFRAWMANLVGLIRMINKEIVIPNDCKIVRIVEWIDSLHIYNGDIDEAKRIRPYAKNPQYMFRKKPESMVFVQRV
jgi:thymidylate synthase